MKFLTSIFQKSSSKEKDDIFGGLVLSPETKKLLAPYIKTFIAETSRIDEKARQVNEKYERLKIETREVFKRTLAELGKEQAKSTALEFLAKSKNIDGTLRIAKRHIDAAVEMRKKADASFREWCTTISKLLRVGRKVQLSVEKVSQEEWFVLLRRSQSMLGCVENELEGVRRTVLLGYRKMSGRASGVNTSQVSYTLGGGP